MNSSVLTVAVNPRVSMVSVEFQGLGGGRTLKGLDSGREFKGLDGDCLFHSSTLTGNCSRLFTHRSVHGAAE